MGNQWANQRELKKEGPDTINSIILTADSIDNYRTRALFVLLYLTAARIGELVRYKRKNVKGEWNKYASIRKKDFSFVERNGRKIILIKLRNEKHKSRFTKELPVPLDREENVTMWNMVKEYLDQIELEQELFSFNYQYGYKQIIPYCNPHWLRHVRLTHLITVYDFNENLLQRFAGWTDTRPSKHYAELKWKDYLDKL